MNRKIRFRTLLPVVFTAALLFSVLFMDVAGYCKEGKDADGNGTYDTAAPLQMKKTVKDALNEEDDTDFYKIEVEKNNKVMFVFTADFKSPYFTIEDGNKTYVPIR